MTHGKRFIVVGSACIAIGLVIAAALATAAGISTSMARIAMDVDPNPNDVPHLEGQSDVDLEHPPVDWQYWRSVNPDVIGWLQVPGTAIDQPVVQAPVDDPQRYLTHDVYGNWNYHGCPYVDAGCAEGLESPHVVICGHNLLDRTMFTELENFHDRAFAEAHRQMTLHTPNGTRHLRVAGAETVAGWNPIKRTSFANDEDFRAYADERLTACDVRLSDDLPTSQLLTLCTCSYFDEPGNERTLVYAF